MATGTVASGLPPQLVSPTVDDNDQRVELPAVQGPQFPQFTANTTLALELGAPLQQSAYQHAVQQVASVTTSNSSPTVESRDHTHTAKHLNTGAVPFAPCGLANSNDGDPLVQVRPIEDVLRDHSEVEKVLNGGKGTPVSDTGAWHSGADVSADSSQVSQLPFSAGDIPVGFVIPAKPVAKTNSLKEIRVKFNDNVFIDRILPAPALPITAHARFTPNY